jgi:hypothetical protein
MLLKVNAAVSNGDHTDGGWQIDKNADNITNMRGKHSEHVQKFVFPKIPRGIVVE